MKLKALNAIDFYKAGHIYQYPAKTQMVFSNLTPRSNKHLKIHPSVKQYSPEGVVFFGLQGFIRWYLEDLWQETFFSQPVEEVIKDYMSKMDAALGKGRVTPDHIYALHKLGYLPLEILALPEGTICPIKVPVLTIYNTHQDFFWLTNYIETVMSSELWMSITNATIAKLYRNIFDAWAERTCDNKGHVTYQAHDFSFRGLPGFAAASASGTAHLTSFQGTDSLAGMDFALNYYDADLSTLGFAVAATEHAVMCMGTKEDEIGTYRRLICETYPTGIVSIVSDTWDLWKVLTEYSVELKSEIEARDGKVVFRPDSGNPVDILCGLIVVTENLPTNVPPLEVVNQALLDNLHDLAQTLSEEEVWEFIAKIKTFDTEVELLVRVSEDFKYSYTPVTEKASYVKGAVECLWDIFGGKVNSKGYKELSEKVGLLYGDSITPERANEIFTRLEAKGFASNCVLLGIGSYTYQYNTRDTFGMAIKATAGIVDGESREIFKNPITDSGVKKSARGFLQVRKDEDGKLKLVDQIPLDEIHVGELKSVFSDGRLVNPESLDTIRKRLGTL